MLIFSLLTINDRRKRRILLFVCTTTPHGVQKFYITFTTDDIIYKSFMSILYFYIKFKIISTRIKTDFETMYSY
jgi:hypothetical protein